jgi:hypothetical protein
MSVPSREQFVDQVHKQVAKKFPLVKLEPTQQAFALKVNGHVASLENLYRTVLLRPEEGPHQIDRWIVELLRASEGSPDQGGNFGELRDRILPMLVPSVGGPPGHTVSQAFVEGLSIAYAIDSDRTIAYIPQGQFESWTISLDELHETALANLVARSSALEAHAAQDEEGGVNLILFQKLDGYDASRLLLPTLHDRLREYLGSPFCAGVPNRDILLCFRNDEKSVQRLHKQIKADYAAMPHQITDRLLLVTPDGIAWR